MSSPLTWRLLLLAPLVGCVTPYHAECHTFKAAFAPDAFDRMLAVVQASYPRLESSDRDAFRLRTDWATLDRGDQPGQRRATVYADGDRTLCVVVEVRYLRVSLFGDPSWGPVRGHPPLERDLLAALREALP